MTVLVGIDPGIENVGIAVYDLQHPDHIFSCTCHSSSLQPTAERLGYIQHFVVELKAASLGLLDKVDYLVVEKQPGKLNEIVSWATGVVLQVMSPQDIIIFNPCAMKKEVTGDGWATKEDIRSVLMAAHKLDITNIDDHQVDAIGLIFAGIKRNGLLRAIEN